MPNCFRVTCGNSPSAKDYPANRLRADWRIAARSMFSRQFIKVSKVLKIRALISSVIGNPLVATFTNTSPRDAIFLKNSTCRSCGVFPSAVALRVSAHSFSINKVKCKMHICSWVSPAGTMALHPFELQLSGTSTPGRASFL